MSGQDNIHVGILETGHIRAEFRDEHGTFADWFTRWLGAAAGGRFSFSSYYACDGELPASTDACDGYVITGSAASVTEQAGWMKELQGFARASAKTKRVVGFCFGHQLLADAWGGTVEQSEKGWGVGVHTYDIHSAKPWMAPAAPSVSILASHMDQVTRVPEGAEVLAGNDFCPNGMLQLDDNVLSFQNHPELSKALARDIYGVRREQLGVDVADTALASLDDEVHSDLVGTWITSFLARRPVETA
jgi:GMP synthase-like glutamine amidotransferase